MMEESDRYPSSQHEHHRRLINQWTVVRILTMFLMSTLMLAQANTVKSQHTSNHAVIVSSSRYWFNYRHAINALSIYQVLKDNGFCDENIILMLADEYAANARNPIKNQMLVHNNNGQTSSTSGGSLYNGSLIEIDYRGDDVTVENFVHVLTSTSTNNRNNNKKNGLPVLNSDSGSNVLIYLTGHGGDQFFKFQDVEEIMAADIAAALFKMHQLGKYNEVLLVADTCQAFTLGDFIEAKNVPNVTVIGSSLKGESSYARHSHDVLGLSVIERYTYALVYDNIRNSNKGLDADLTIQQAMVDPYSYAVQRAHIGVRDDGAVRKVHESKMVDFFANVETMTMPMPMTTADDRVSKTTSSLLFFQSDYDDNNDNNMHAHLPFPDAMAPSTRANTEDGEMHPPLTCGASTTNNDVADVECAVAFDETENVHRPPAQAALLFLWNNGMEPSDASFVALVAIFLGSVAWASRFY